MNVYNSTKNTIITSKAIEAKNPLSRGIGLIGKKEISPDECLIIRPCFSIHTFFMKFAIDVLFVNSENEIIAIFQDVKPNRVLPIKLHSAFVIELKSGTVASKKIELNDRISFME